MRSSAWIRRFSSTHSTIALSGGSRDRPTISRTFSTHNGSLESLNLCWRYARAWRIQQALQTVFDEARSLIGNGLGRHPLANGNGLVFHAIGTARHNAHPQGHGLRGLAPQGQSRELFTLRIAEHPFLLGSASHGHRAVSTRYR